MPLDFLIQRHFSFLAFPFDMFARGAFSFARHLRHLSRNLTRGARPFFRWESSWSDPGTGHADAAHQYDY